MTATDEVDAIIAAKIITDELVAELEAAFWRDLTAVRRGGGISTNEIARRLDAAGIASRPTTLAKISGVRSAELTHDLERAGAGLREMTASMQRAATSLRELLATAPEEQWPDEPTE